MTVSMETMVIIANSFTTVNSFLFIIYVYTRTFCAFLCIYADAIATPVLLLLVDTDNYYPVRYPLP